MKRALCFGFHENVALSEGGPKEEHRDANLRRGGALCGFYVLHAGDIRNGVRVQLGSSFICFVFKEERQPSDSWSAETVRKKSLYVFLRANEVELSALKGLLQAFGPCLIA